MGYIIEAKVLKFRNTYLYQRKCNACKDVYLFHLSETKTYRAFFCESCTPEPVEAEQTDSEFGAIRAIEWDNRIIQSHREYKVARLSKKNFKLVLQRDCYICQYCYKEGSTVDHIKPVVYGGTNHVWNLVCACQRCNSTAGSLVFTDWLEKQRYVRKKIKLE